MVQQVLSEKFNGVVGLSLVGLSESLAKNEGNVFALQVLDVRVLVLEQLLESGLG